MKGLDIFQLMSKNMTVFFILDGCSFHYAHIWSKSGISICWRHFVTSKEPSNPNLSSENPILHHSCAICSERPSYISTMLSSEIHRKTCWLTPAKRIIPGSPHGFYIRWFLNYLRTYDVNIRKKTGFDDSFDVTKCVQQIEMPDLLYVCA